MKTKYLVTTPLMAVLALTGLAGCGASDTAAETCEKIEVIQDEHGRDLFPSVGGRNINDGDAAVELDAVYSDWKDVRKDASDDRLNSAMSDMERVFDDYEEYIEAYLDEDADPGHHPGDKMDNRSIAQSAGAVIDEVCSDI